HADFNACRSTSKLLGRGQGDRAGGGCITLACVFHFLDPGAFERAYQAGGVGGGRNARREKQERHRQCDAKRRGKGMHEYELLDMKLWKQGSATSATSKISEKEEKSEADRELNSERRWVRRSRKKKYARR